MWWYCAVVFVCKQIRTNNDMTFVSVGTSWWALLQQSYRNTTLSHTTVLGFIITNALCSLVLTSCCPECSLEHQIWINPQLKSSQMKRIVTRFHHLLNESIRTFKFCPLAFCLCWLNFAQGMDGESSIKAGEAEDNKEDAGSKGE